ncbi:hypothetical protein DFH07DRAFT_774504 [Mycena maculata]|uniref:Uncharacterized protein n=1 Tax=Mycena maculata TaxID=230809 RepID=A0AAD7NB13_9AGAR|nr:hypothetical protein DFH07DRAFT_774504 [Mycena maculata]
MFHKLISTAILAILVLGQGVLSTACKLPLYLRRRRSSGLYEVIHARVFHEALMVTLTQARAPRPPAGSGTKAAVLERSSGPPRVGQASSLSMGWSINVELLGSLNDIYFWNTTFQHDIPDLKYGMRATGWHPKELFPGADLKS